MSLSFITVAWSMLSGVSLSVGLVHLFVWMKRPKLYGYLAFFVAATSIAVLLMIELRIMHSQSTTEFGTLLRWSHIPIFIFITASIIFLRIYFQAGRLWLAYLAFGLRLLLVIVNFSVYPNIHYREITALKSLTLWNGESVAVAVGVAGQWQFLGPLSSFVLLLFVLDVMISTRRRGDATERRRATVIGGSFIVVVASVSINSALIHWGVISHSFYLFGSFMFVVLAIANELGADITQSATLAVSLGQRRAELRDTQRRMDLASSAAAVGTWEWDFERDHIFASDQARLMYGMSVNEPINFQRFLSSLHASDREAVRQAVMQSLEDGHRFQREYRVQQGDGHITWILSRGRVETGADGNPVLRGVSLDVSERKLADERFREVVEAAPTGMLIMGGNGTIILVNSQIEVDFGYSRQELIGQSLEILIPARFRARHPDYRNQFSGDQSARPMAPGQTVFGLCKDGREIPLEIGLNPLHSKNGEEILASITNISERKRREEILQHERAFLRQVIDISPGLIFAKDREGRFTLVNQAVATMYGTTIENLIGKTDADFNHNVNEVEAFRRADLDVMNTLEKHLILEEPITDATGKVHWLQTVKLPVLNQDGSADQLLGTATDISERKKTELDLAQQRNELAHLSRVMMLSELSGSLAHELNQPLAAILSNAQAALRFLGHDNPNLDEIREILRDIVNDDRRAGEVIQGLRLLLKKGEMRREAIDANTLVDSVIKLLRSDMLNAGVAYSTLCAPALPRIDGIAVQLQQVLLNLMVNACDAMTAVPNFERRLVVSTELTADDCVMFCVRDHGNGISLQQPEQVFEPFFTTKTQGLGLGLAVCRKLIDAHGGRIWASNNEWRGASFCFTVPINREQAR